MSVPEREPVAPGVNVTRIVHELPFARVVPHVPPARAKSLPFVPVNETEIPVIPIPMVFESVKLAAELVIPTISEPNELLDGESVTAPVVVPAPDSAAVCGLSPSPPL